MKALLSGLQNETLKKISKANALTGSKTDEVKGFIQEDYREIPGTQFAFVSGIILFINCSIVTFGCIFDIVSSSTSYFSVSI